MIILVWPCAAEDYKVESAQMLYKRFKVRGRCGNICNGKYKPNVLLLCYPTITKIAYLKFYIHFENQLILQFTNIHIQEEIDINSFPAKILLARYSCNYKR